MDQVNYRNSISSFSSKRTLGSLDLRLPEIRAKSSHRVTRNSEKIVPLWDEIRRNCFPYYIYNIKTDFNSAKCKWKRSSTAKTRCSNEPPRFFYVEKKTLKSNLEKYLSCSLQTPYRPQGTTTSSPCTAPYGLGAVRALCAATSPYPSPVRLATSPCRTPRRRRHGKSETTPRLGGHGSSRPGAAGLYLLKLKSAHEARVINEIDISAFRNTCTCRWRPDYL